MTPQTHTSFTTTTRGLQRGTPPMVLYEKAKILGTWNPTDFDFSQDRQDWQGLKDDEQDVVLRLTALFQAGEEAVTLDLLPLMMAIAREGRIEEEMYLTTFLFEEAKHTDFFNRFLLEVVGKTEDLSRYHLPNYKAIFHEALPRALSRLLTDQSPEAQIIASITYNMIVEGVLAETGYHVYHTTLRDINLLPETMRGVNLLKQDESRHIAYGIFLISRLLAEHDDLWPVVETTMQTLMVPALGIVSEAFDCYDPVPFGLNVEDFTNYAIMQSQKRFERIMKARGATLDDIYRVTRQAIEDNDS